MRGRSHRVVCGRSLLFQGVIDMKEEKTVSVRESEEPKRELLNGARPAGLSSPQGYHHWPWNPSFVQLVITNTHTHTHTHSCTLLCPLLIQQISKWNPPASHTNRLDPSQGWRGVQGHTTAEVVGVEKGGRPYAHTYSHSCMHAHMLAGLLSRPLGHLAACLWVGLEHAWAYKGLFVPVRLPGLPAEHSAMIEVTRISQ